MGRHPLALPDVELLVEGWRVVSFATRKQQSQKQTDNKAHTFQTPDTTRLQGYTKTP
jgi:hypothetical protein